MPGASQAEGGMIIGDFSLTGSAEGIFIRFFVVFMTEDTVAWENEVCESGYKRLNHNRILARRKRDVKKTRSFLTGSVGMIQQI